MKGEGRCKVVDVDLLRELIEKEVATALRFVAFKADGKEIRISQELAVGKIGGLRRALELLEHQ